jgi:hypothetical protein
MVRPHYKLRPLKVGPQLLCGPHHFERLSLHR